MKNLIPITALLSSALIAGAQPPGVRDGGRPANPPGPWSVGAGVIFQSSPYRGGEDKLMAIPLINYRGERLRIYGPFAEYVVLPGEKNEVALSLKTDFEGYEEDDSDALEGLGDREITLNAGVQLKRDLPSDFRFRVGVFREILSRHDGWILETSLGRTFRDRGNYLRPAVFLRLYDDRYTDYYYGVSPSRARADRPAYDPSEGMIYGVALSGSRQIKGPWSVGGRVGVGWLSSELRGSPVVTRDSEWGAQIGISRSL